MTSGVNTGLLVCWARARTAGSTKLRNLANLSVTKINLLKQLQKSLLQALKYQMPYLAKKDDPKIY